MKYRQREGKKQKQLTARNTGKRISTQRRKEAKARTQQGEEFACFWEEFLYHRSYSRLVQRNGGHNQIIFRGRGSNMKVRNNYRKGARLVIGAGMAGNLLVLPLGSRAATYAYTDLNPSGFEPS